MTDIDAIMLIEGDNDATREEQLEAWAAPIKSGTVWSLQGFYGRGAKRLIEAGLISPEGDVIDA